MSTSSPGPVNLEQVKKHSVFINLQVDLPKREIDHVFPSYGGGGWDPGSGLIYTVNIYIYIYAKTPCFDGSQQGDPAR